MLRDIMVKMRYFPILVSILLIKAALVACLILFGEIGLGPDEAQYWTWSQQLDWGYYSKPPAIAWEIWLGTQLFGNTELGVRAMPLILGSLIPLALYVFSKTAGLSARASFWGAVAFAFSPLGFLATFLAITDTGMVLFWVFGCTLIVDGIRKKAPPHFVWQGLMIFCGSLFKWPIYFLWLLLFFIPKETRFTFSPPVVKRLIEGVALSLLGLLPSLYWNASHEWATFRHVFTTMLGGHAQAANLEGRTAIFFAGNFFEFLGAQAALLFPLLFVFILLIFNAIFYKKSTKIPPGPLFCGRASMLFLSSALFLSLFMKMQGNWCIFAYPTAFVFFSWYAQQTMIRMRLLKWGILFSFIVTCLVFLIPTLQAGPLLGNNAIPYRFNVFNHNVGWKALKKALEEVGYDPKRDFLFSDKYQLASLLSFYSEQQQRAYFLNLQGARKNQFSFWPGLDSMHKRRGFFIVVEKMSKFQNSPNEVYRYEKLLQPYFEKIKPLETKPLFISDGVPAKGVCIFECSSYNGNLPPNSHLY